MEKITGFLLSYLKYGDNDAILHCFTKENGFQSFFLRNIYTAKNKKKAYLLPLNEIAITVSSRSFESKLPSINKLEVAENINFSTDMKQNSIIFFISDFLNQTLKNEQKNIILYKEIGDFRNSIAQNNTHPHYVFLIRLLHFLGIAPLISQDIFLNIEKGIFQKEIHHENTDKEVSAIWKNILENKIDYCFNIEKKMRKSLMDSLLLYYKIHFPDFHTPKSLSVIHQIFE